MIGWVQGEDGEGGKGSNQGLYHNNRYHVLCIIEFATAYIKGPNLTEPDFQPSFRPFDQNKENSAMSVRTISSA